MSSRPTQRLDLHNPLMLTFSARVIGLSTFDQLQTLVLDRTAFYPESGGQMADHGVIGNTAIVDVQADDDGVIHHLVDPGATLPSVGTEVEASIDERRRRFHMAQHTGQHMLSAALLQLAGTKTVSSRLGEAACTIDVDLKKLTNQELLRVEELVNEVIEADVEVRTFFPTPEELAELSLRRRPKVDTGLRVVAVGEFDLVACGGTHCTRSSQVGLVTILSAERYKGMTRLTFVAGRLARTLLAEHNRVLKELALGFTCASADVPKAVDNLRAELVTTKESLASTRALLAKTAANELLSRSTSPRVVETFEGCDAAFLREVGKRIVAEPERVALLAARSDEGTTIFVSRGYKSNFDCGAFVKAVTEAIGGRGGGRQAHAEGRLPPGVDWAAVVESELM